MTGAASRAANATAGAAKWVVDSTSEAASRLKNQVTNADTIAELRAQVEMRAEVLLKVRDLTDKLQETQQQLAESNVYFDKLKGIFAVGVAIAAADGEISEQERTDINEFVVGIANAQLPARVIGALHALLAAPPTFEEAYELATKCGEESMALFDNVIEVAIHADGVVHPAELAFQERWKAIRKEACA